MLLPPDTSEKERTWEEIRQHEDSVLGSKWNVINKAQRGIKNLREALSKILEDMIKLRSVNLTSND